jgi:uncharacterized repeat protein (TIGR01451 family)
MRLPVCLRFSLVLVLVVVPGALVAQYPAPVMLPPPLYVRLAGPPGMKVTVYRGSGQGQTLTAPCVIGFRPGYRYRLQLGNLEGRRGWTVYPALDVVGSLRMPSVQAAGHPATLFFTDDDFASVAAGAVVSKVVVLERPETALPVASAADRPIEQTLPPNRDLLVQAQERGRPVLLLHLGGREYTAQELALQAIPGTMLLPGEKVLPPPRDPPCLPWLCYPLVDPLAGPDCPGDEMCFHDGGDNGSPAGYGPDGKLRGLDPSDTIAQFHDSKGNPKIAISNRVCLCVPRFVVLRTELSTAFNMAQTKTGDTRIFQAPGKVQIEANTLIQKQDSGVAGLNSQQRPSSLQQEQHAYVTGRVEGLQLVSSDTKTGNVAGSCPAPEEAEPCDKPLVIIKWPDKCDPQIGEVVTFYIRYKNQGHRPITGIIVNDSLTARLEYVSGSARTDRDALFTTTPNEATSLRLRWEISGALQPGQTGIVSFQVRVR